MLKVILPYFLLAVALVLLFSMWRSNRELERYRREDNRRAQETISRHEATIKSKDDRINEIEAKRIHARDSAKVAQNAAKREIEVYKKTIIRLRPQIAPIVAENDTLGAFIQAMDSVIEKQDSLIHDQELFCQLQVRDLGRIIQLNEEKYLAQTKITDAWRETAQGNESLLRKEKRSKNFFKIVSGVLVGGIVYIALKE